MRRVWRVIYWGSLLAMTGYLLDGVLVSSFSSLGCKLGRAAACVESGLAAHDAEPPRYDEALGDWRKACDEGSARGCQNLGVLYEAGHGVKRDLGEASRRYERACREGEWLACRNLANLLERGAGLAQDRGRARQLFERACAHGYASACNDLGLRFEDQLGASDRAAYFRKACDGRSTEGCVSLALVLAEGEGLAADTAEAKRLLSEACVLQEHARACYSLARLHEDRVLGQVDAQRVSELHARACGLGYASSCLKSALQARGDARQARYDQAVAAYARGCRDGDVEDCLGETTAKLLKTHTPRDVILARLATACEAYPGEECPKALAKMLRAEAALKDLEFESVKE